MLFTKPFKYNIMKRDFWTPKNLVTCILIARNHPGNVRDTYVRIKLQKDMHHLWAERKTSLRLKSDDELARHLLSLSIVHVHLSDGEEFSVSAIDIAICLRVAISFLTRTQ